MNPFFDSIAFPFSTSAMELKNELRSTFLGPLSMSHKPKFRSLHVTPKSKKGTKIPIFIKKGYEKSELQGSDESAAIIDSNSFKKHTVGEKLRSQLSLFEGN